MAVTAIWDVKGQIASVIRYTANPAKTWNANFGEAAKFHQLENVLQYTADAMKTEQQFFVSGVNCSANPEQATKQMNDTKVIWKKTDGIICFHGYQAFAPGEVTPEIAHEVGVKFAERMWGDRFEVLVSTHLNTGKIHNHFVVNSVSFIDGKRYYDQKQTYARIRQLSDELCEEYGLSVIYEPRGTKEHIAVLKMKEDGRVSQREFIKEAIDRAIDKTTNMRDFKQVIGDDGYVLEYRGSFLRIRPDEGKKFFRFDRLGEGYTEDDIRRRLRENYLGRPRPKTTFQFKKRDKAKGLYALYLHYQYLLGNLPKSRPNNKEAYAAMREDSRRMKMYSEEAVLLATNHIVTADDLHDFTAGLSQSFKLTAIRRAKVRNKLRWMHDSEAMQPLKDEITELSDRLAELRRQMKLCVDIAERSGAVEAVVNTIEREQEVPRKEEKQNTKSKERDVK